MKEPLSKYSPQFEQAWRGHYIVTSHQIPTMRIAAGMTKRIQYSSQRGAGSCPSADSDASAALRSKHQPTVSTAIKAPSVCIPEPNVRSQGMKIALLIVGGIEITNTAALMIHTARARVSVVLSVNPATSTSKAATSDR